MKNVENAHTIVLELPHLAGPAQSPKARPITLFCESDAGEKSLTSGFLLIIVQYIANYRHPDNMDSIIQRSAIE
ncbi:hypothetical protein D3C74_406930 [compost metagenome]